MRSINLAWIEQAAYHRHLFKQEWLGERFFHLPGDMLALQHLFWTVRPQAAVLTGIAAGGGPVFAASMLDLLGGERRVIAIDPVVHADVRVCFARHPQAKCIEIVEGRTTDKTVFDHVRERVAGVETKGDPLALDVFDHVRERVAGLGPVLVVLDHEHTHAHVLRELELYSQLVSVGSYLVVLDTIMEDLPDGFFAGKPYGKGNNPGTALRAFLASPAAAGFEIDYDIEDRVLMTLAPGGFVRRVR